MTKNKPRVISLFTCGMGMDLGFEGAKFKLVYANDIAKYAYDTIKENRKNIPCDHGDIAEISSKDILRKSKVKKREIDVIIGGPPCQSFSTAGMRKGIEDKRGLTVLQFIRIIKDIQPKFFVFENVPGLKSMAKKHMSFYERVATNQKKLSNDQKYGSLFKEIVKHFESIKGYKIKYEIFNAADYGVAQKRKRLILIGSRKIHPDIIFEDIKKSQKFADPKKAELGKEPWKTLEDVLDGLVDNEPECKKFPKWGKYLKQVPPGGCWIDLHPRSKKKAMGRAADTNDPKRKGKQGGRRGFFRRLSWDAPAPTLVTTPIQMGTCICHPDETRPLTVKEYARIQGFPDDWKFVGTISQKYRLIGEAVPVDFAKVIAKTIYKFCSE